MFKYDVLNEIYIYNYNSEAKIMYPYIRLGSYTCMDVCITYLECIILSYQKLI